MENLRQRKKLEYIVTIKKSNTISCKRFRIRYCSAILKKCYNPFFTLYTGTRVTLLFNYNSNHAMRTII